MTILNAGQSRTIWLQVGEVLTLAASVGATGSVTRLANPQGGEPYSPVPYTGAALTVGPFDVMTLHKIAVQTGTTEYAVVQGIASEEERAAAQSRNALTLTAGRQAGASLQRGLTMAIGAAVGTGSVVPQPLSNGGEPGSPVAYTGSAITFGPYAQARRFLLACASGQMPVNIGYISTPAPTPTPTPTSLVANPGGAVDTVVGAIVGAQTYETGGPEHYIEGKGTAKLKINISADGQNWYELNPGDATSDGGVALERWTAGVLAGNVINYIGVGGMSAATLKRTSIEKVGANYVARIYTDGVLRSTSGTLADTRNTRVGTAAGTNATEGKYGGSALMLAVTASAYSVPTNKMTFSFDYFAPSAVNISATVAGTPVAVTILSNSPAGKAQIELTVPNGLGGTQPSVVLTTKLASDNTTVVGTATVNSLLIPRAARFGSNLPDDTHYLPGFRIFKNILIQGKWNRTDDYNSVDFTGILDAKGQPIAMPPGGGLLRRQIGHGDVSGAQVELTWNGGAMTVGVGTSEGNTTLTGFTSPNANSRRFYDNFAHGSGNTFGYVQISAIDTGNPPTDLWLAPVGEPKTGIFSDAFVAFVASFQGAFRVLDLLGTNGANFGQTWAARPTPDMLIFPYNQWPVEFLIALANSTGRDLYVPVPGFATDDWYTKFFTALHTGANTTNGVGLNAGIKVYVAYSNEVWNVAFPIRNKLRNEYSLRTGEPVLGDGAGGVDQIIKEHAYRHNAMMTLLEAISGWADRFVRVFETQQSAYQYNTWKANGGAHYDALAMAPYFHGSWSVGQSVDPVDLEGSWIAAALAQLEALKPLRDLARGDGKRFITYEGGADFYVTGMPAAAITAFKRSPQWYNVMHAYLAKWRDDFGDDFNHYTALGGTPSHPANWGLLEYQNAPHSQGYLAAMAVQASL